MQFWPLHEEHHFSSKEENSRLNNCEFKSKKRVAGLINFSQFVSETSFRCKENENSVCAIIWTFFGTFDAIRREYESIKSVKMVIIDSLIKDDANDDKVKRWRRSLIRISILESLYANANLVWSFEFYLAPSRQESFPLKLSPTFPTEKGISCQQSVAQVQRERR